MGILKIVVGQAVLGWFRNFGSHSCLLYSSAYVFAHCYHQVGGDDLDFLLLIDYEASPCAKLCNAYSCGNAQ
jgi:hypothetical protein